MSLLPSTPKSKSAKLAQGGKLALGYESQLGASLSGDGVGAAVGDALYQNLPPLAVPYVSVKPADLASIQAEAAAEGKEKGSKLLDDISKAYNAATKDARMTATHRAQLGKVWNEVLGEAVTDLQRDPTHFVSDANRAQFMQKVSRVLDPGFIASAQNQYDTIKETRAKQEAAGELDDIAIVNGQRLPGTTYRQLYNEALAEKDERKLARLAGVELPDGAPFLDVAHKIFGGLDSGYAPGTFKDTEDTLRSMQGLIKTSEHGGKQSQETVRQLATLTGVPEERLYHTGGGSTTISNQQIIDGVKHRVQQLGWRAVLGNPKAVAGLEKAKQKEVDQVATRSDVTLANGQVIPKGTARLDAERLAYEAGDRKVSRFLAQKRGELVDDMALQYLNTQLNLGLVNSHTSEREQSWGGTVGKTKEKEEGAGKLDWWGRIQSQDASLEQQQVRFNDLNGQTTVIKDPLTGKPKQQFVPTATTYGLYRAPMDVQQQMNEYIKTGTGDKQRHKTLAEIGGAASSVLAAPGRAFKTGNAWQGGIDPNKLEVTGYEGEMHIPESGLENEYQAIKRHGQQLKHLLESNRLSPAQYATIKKQKEDNDLVEKTLLVPYHVMRVAGNARDFEAANDHLAYKDKDGKTVKPIGDWQSFKFPVSPYTFNRKSPIQENNPYDMQSLQMGDPLASERDADGIDRPVGMRVFVRNDNAAFNDPSGMRATYDFPAEVKKYVRNISAAQDKHQAQRAPLAK